MKNLKTILTIGLALGAVGVMGGSLFYASKKDTTIQKAEAVISAQDYVVVNTTNFWSDDYNIGDQICHGNATFFDPGRFFGTTRPLINTININEGKTGDIRSDDFNQTGEYVSFLMGGKPHIVDGHPQNFINVWSTDKGYNIASEICNDAFSDPDISCNMVFKYVQIPSEYRGKCLIYMHDGTTGSFGGITFGDLRINQTWDDVVAAFSAHIATYALSCNNEANTNAYNAVKNYYDTNAYYASLRSALAAKTSADDGFEKQNSLINWAYDRLNSTYANGDLMSIDFEGIISDNDIKEDGYFTVGMPTNKTGNYYVRAENSGVPEDAKYRIVSSEFTLSGTGFISAKLGGGTAVLELLDDDYNVLVSSATAEATGTNILRPGFQDGSQSDTFNLAESGVRLNTMSRVYLDCSQYLGERVRVALSDARTGGTWGLAYFDEVITYYANVPTFKVDVAAQGTHFLTIPDEYVGSNTTDFGKAYTFWRSYLNTVRNGKMGANYCSNLTSDDFKALLTAYNALPTASKQIVCGSVDFERVGDGTWYDIEPTIYNPNDTYNIARSIHYFGEANGVNVVVYGSNAPQMLNAVMINSTSSIIIIASFIIFACALILIVCFKRKKKAR